MKQKNLVFIILAAIVGAIVALILSGMVFNAPSKRAQVPEVDKITPSFPDVKNDPNYSSFLNGKAIDPTEPIQIGNSQNTSPFSP